MSAIYDVKFFSVLAKIRSKKALLLLYLLASIIIGYAIYVNQVSWLDFNCNHGRYSNSCIYKIQRLYLVPVLGIIGCIFFLFIDKVLIFLIMLNKKLENLSLKVHAKILIIYSLVLSIFLFGFRFSFYILDPRRIEWISHFGRDLSLNFLSWHIFRDSPWSFPLGYIESINYPDGISIAYSDPTMLFCVLFKLLNPLLPSYFQYLGIWYFLNYALQGLFAALIFKNIKCSLKLKLLAVPFLIFSTVLLDRVSHLTLNAHWLILASFYLYLSSEMSNKKKIIWHSIIVYITVWLHPYLTFMLFSLFSALILKIYFTDKKQFKFLSFLFTFTFISVFISWYIIGYFHLGHIVDDLNLSYRSNLNTFINSMGKYALLNPLPSTGGDYEGSAYLGLGLLMILVVLLFEKWPKQKYIFNKENKYLLWIIVILTLLATGLNFKFGNITILNISKTFLIDYIFIVYRSMGRFIWPVYYFIIIFSLLSLIFRERSIYKKYILFIIALIIQLIDLYPLYKPVALNLANGFSVKRDFSPWVKFMGADKNKLIFYPNQEYFYEDFWLLSKEYKYSTNIGYFARIDLHKFKENEKNVYKNIVGGYIPRDTVYVVLKNEMKLFPTDQKNKNLECEIIQEFYACKNKN
ncbi:DUF6311 domain-containing protein [Fluviispira vulneris]|uniref:DUF6311 domain-containing protein n=1 Tax=Fluviispira vulneris TaxID=2763012 RepID=UPI001648058B|nr:DUF6311 domain-containing protein [Fluviispira vulneris]